MTVVPPYPNGGPILHSSTLRSSLKDFPRFSAFLHDIQSVAQACGRHVARHEASVGGIDAVGCRRGRCLGVGHDARDAVRRARELRGLDDGREVVPMLRVLVVLLCSDGNEEAHVAGQTARSFFLTSERAIL